MAIATVFPLLTQGAIMSVETNIPSICSVGDSLGTRVSSEPKSSGAKPPPPTSIPVLPAGTRMWETVPGVIRNNGADTCRVEVNVNGPVSNVTMQLWDRFQSESGLATVTLRDDGLQGDRVAGDRVFTSELIHYNTNYNASGVTPYYWDDTNSPTGLIAAFISTVTVFETNGTQSQFLIHPKVGVLWDTIPLVHTVQLSSNVIASPHLLNVRGTNLVTQKFLREYSHSTDELTKKIYAVFPDAFDFCFLFSTYRIEDLPYDTSYNLIAGSHQMVKVNYTGTGQSLADNTALFGSAGRLLGLAALDVYDRGIYAGNCVHELLHQWASFMPAFPFSDGAHYVPRSNAGSLLGGFLWQTNGFGTWTEVCSEGINGATHLDNLDKYLMGLIPTNQVVPMRVYPSSDPPPNAFCGQTISNVAAITTIQSIVNTYGQRTPGAATSKRDFSLAFLVEGNNRLLNSVELTYYDVLADHFVKLLPQDQPDPYVGFNWAPVVRFFGEGTTWSSDVLALIAAQITSITALDNGSFRISGLGYPGRSYRLLRAPEPLSLTWSDVATTSAGTNGFLAFTNSPAGAASAFYKISTP